MGIDEVMRNKDINPLKWSNDIQNNFKVIDPCQAGKNYRNGPNIEKLKNLKTICKETEYEEGESVEKMFEELERLRLKEIKARNKRKQAMA